MGPRLSCLSPGSIFVRSPTATTIICAGWISCCAAFSTPDAVTKSFYTWYLQQIAGNHDPLTTRDPQLRTYVSAPLLREIRQRMASPEGLDADYFIQAQDYLDQWLGKIATSETHVRGATAMTVVTLVSS